MNSVLPQTFHDVPKDGVPALSQSMKRAGARFVQLCATMDADGTFELNYSFVLDGEMQNHIVRGLTEDDTIPSITDNFLAAFVFENEAHDLFGLNITGIAIDFGGKFYNVAVDKPMTIISPEMLAAREKAAKVAAAKAAKEAKEAKAAQAAQVAKEAEADVEQAKMDEVEAKLAGLPPEKAEKVRAAMKAKAEREAKAALEAEIEAKCAGLPPEKAAKVRAAMEAKFAKAAAERQGE